MVAALTQKRQDLGTKSNVLSHLKHNQVSTHLEYKSQNCCLNPTFSLSLVPPVLPVTLAPTCPGPRGALWAWWPLRPFTQRDFT